MKDKIILILPTLPVYRLDFLVKLNLRLELSNKELIVFTGLNNKRKVIKEIDSTLPFKVIRIKTIGIKFLNLNLNWQKELITRVMDEEPAKVIILLNPGNINYLLLLIKLKIRQTPFIIWGSGYRRVDLDSKLLFLKHKIQEVFEDNASGYITYSDYFKDQLIQRGYRKEKIITAQNTINIDDNILSLDLGAREYKHIRFLFVGAVIPQKKLDIAIRACAKLKEKGYYFQFDIVGGGEILQDLEFLIKQIDLNEYVFIHGPKYENDVIPFFQKSNVFLLPGTGGLAINEAMSYALPIISTPGDGTAYDLVINEKNGFLLDYDYSMEELRNKMQYFIDAREETLIEMGNSSLEIITKKGTLKNMVGKFVEGIEIF